MKYTAPIALSCALLAGCVPPPPAIVKTGSTSASVTVQAKFSSVTEGFSGTVDRARMPDIEREGKRGCKSRGKTTAKLQSSQCDKSGCTFLFACK